MLTLLLCSSILACGQGFDKAKLDQYLTSLEKHDKVMLSLALFKDGEPIYQRAIGYAATETEQKADINTQYRIGSITKVFTAVLIFQLIEEGKLTLNTPLSEYYPGVKNADQITISHLLSHRSGIHNFTNTPGFLAFVQSPKTKAEMLQYIEGMDSDFAPDSNARYSNSAYVLLGFIIEDLTGQSYAEAVDARIVKKLNLEKTRYGTEIKPTENQAKSYRFNFGGWTPSTVTDMTVPGGAGALISTPTDLGHFYHALFHEQLVTQASLNLMKEINQGYGRGLFGVPFWGKTGIGHNGGIDAFVSNSLHFEAEGLTIAYTANGVNMVLNDFLIGVLSIYFNRPFTLPDFDAEPITLSAKTLAKYQGVFTSNDLPIKITLELKGEQLIAQATGQGPIPLTPFSETEFRYEQAGINITFTKEGKKMDYGTFTLKQGSGKFTFTKEGN